MSKILSPRLIPALIALSFSGASLASGFQLQNQTGSGNGNAFAGAAASAEDAGTVMWNPAGMVYLPAGHNISLAGTVLHRDIRYSDSGSTATPGFPLGSTDGGNAGGLSLVPAGYWTYSLSPSLAIGLGVSPTFGNVTEYDFAFVGRNAGYYADIKQININPSIAWRVNERLALGAGINFAHNETQFKQGLAFLAVGATSNHLDVKGDDWAVGYNLGAMFQLSPATRIGLSYRSQLDFDLEGRQKTSVTGFGSPLLANVDIKAGLKTPANASLAVSHKISERLELLGDVTWTDWSVVDVIQLKNKATDSKLSALSYNFKDSWRIGLGVNYQYSTDWKLRFGVAHDKSPVKSSADRTMTLPDSDRTWLSLGARYRLSPRMSVDVGYSHLFFANAGTARAVQFPAGVTRQTINGKWDNSVDILSAQLNYNF